MPGHRASLWPEEFSDLWPIADGRLRTEDDLSCAILSALSRPLPAPAINAFLRLPAPTRAEFLEGHGLDEDLALDELCQLGLSGPCCRPRARRASRTRKMIA